MRPKERQLVLIRQCRADWPTELTTTTGASTEEDEPEDSTTSPEASMEDVEGTMRPRFQGQQRRLHVMMKGLSNWR